MIDFSLVKISSYQPLSGKPYTFYVPLAAEVWAILRLMGQVDGASELSFLSRYDKLACPFCSDFEGKPIPPLDPDDDTDIAGLDWAEAGIELVEHAYTFHFMELVNLQLEHVNMWFHWIKTYQNWLEKKLYDYERANT